MKFKTNLMCDGCKSRITPLLDREKGIKGWELNLADENKTLTIEENGITKEEVIDLLGKAGYKASSLD
ncbi:heavy-metal-associated domain-containing protein [Bacteroidota bacterium]